MFNIVLATMPFKGHLTTTCLLAEALQNTGYSCGVIAPREVEKEVRKYPVEQIYIGDGYLPDNFLEDFSRCSEGLSGMDAFMAINKALCVLIEMNLKLMPDLIRRRKADLLIIDHVAWEVSAVARHLDIPFIVNGSSINFNRDNGRLPPCYSFNEPGLTEEKRIKNLQLFRHVDELIYDEITSRVDRQCRIWNIKEFGTRCLDVVYKNKLMEIQPSLKEFDFPHNLDIVYTGPWIRTSNSSNERKNEVFKPKSTKPLVYASMGTIVNRQKNIYVTIAETCAELDCELVIGLGSGFDPEELGNLPGSPTVFCYAPQLDILKYARLFISHAGINSVMESLSNSVPLVCIPISNDQPGTAMRVKHAGVGEFIQPEMLSKSNLVSAVSKVMNDEKYYLRAEAFAKSISKSGGVKEAASVIDNVCKSQLMKQNSPADKR